VRIATGLVQQIAQEESKLRRKFEADDRNKKYWQERALGKVAESNTSVKHHRARAVIAASWREVPKRHWKGMRPRS